MIPVKVPNSTLPTLDYGKQPDKDGEPQPPLYPHGVFITTSAGTVSIDCPEDIAAVLPPKGTPPAQPAPVAPVQLALFGASHD